ncbi:MAG: amidohydrolase family protein [Pseudonocardiaceae bacterium]
MITGSGRALPPVVLCLLVLLFAALPTDVVRQAAVGGPVVAITNVTVIDATGAPEQPGMTVVLRGDRIAALGASRQVPVPHEATVVDGAGKFVIPGLWDMHVHPYDESWLALFVANGVTGIRVMKGTPDHHRWRQDVQDGKLPGPRMVIASNLIDGPHPIWPGSVAVSNETEARQAVQQAQQKGADFLKVYSLLPRAAYFALADEAHRRNIVFAGHVPDAITPTEASDAGQRSIEHLTGITVATSTREAGISAELARTPRKPDPTHQRNTLELQAAQSHSPELAQSLFARFARNGTWQVPTLTVLRSLSRVGDARYGQDERLRYIPPELAESWQRFPRASRSPQELADQQTLFRHQLALVDAMNRAGVGLLAGTDTLNPFCFPGFSLHDELELLVEAGLTPMQALQSATRNPAQYLDELDKAGTITAGKRADLVLLDADPLTDIRNTRRINAVVAAGMLLPRNHLDAMLAGAETPGPAAGTGTAGRP